MEYAQSETTLPSISPSWQPGSSSSEYEIKDISVNNNTFKIKTQKLPPDITAPKFCLICGEDAHTCHYGVASCAGCRTFFRRAIVGLKKYECQSNGTCDVLKCRGCRLNRCIMMGMNPSAIKPPEGTTHESIIECVETRKRSLLADGGVNSIAIKKLPVSIQTQQSRDIDYLCFLELKVQHLRESDYKPFDLFHASILQVLKSSLALANADKYEKGRPQIGDKNREANMEKWFRYHKHGALYDAQGNQILHPMHDGENHLILYDEKGVPVPHPKYKEKKLFKSMKWVILDIIIAIEMAKVLPFFNELTEEEKVSLLRHTALINVKLMSAYYSYVQNSEVVVMPDGSVPIKQINSAANLELDVFVRILEPFRRNQLTREEYVLIKVIAMCDPNVKNLSNRSRRILQTEQERYTSTLLRHLQVSLGDVQGAVRFGQVMNVYESMIYFAQRHREFDAILKLKQHVFYQTHKEKRPDKKPPRPHQMLDEVIGNE